VLPQKAADEPRFTLLQTIREFAAEQLQSAGETDAARHAHGACYLGLAQGSERWLRGPEQRWWLDRLEDDVDNFREALRFFLKRQDAEQGLRLASALQWF
jgi:predicted ATPase